MLAGLTIVSGLPNQICIAKSLYSYRDDLSERIYLDLTTTQEWKSPLPVDVRSSNKIHTPTQREKSENIAVMLRFKSPIFLFLLMGII